MRIAWLLICILLIPLSSSASIIWSEDFDALDDWSNTCRVCSHDYSGYGGAGAEDGTPIGFDYWRSDEHWNPDDGSLPTVGSQPGIRIAASSSYGGTTGKSLIIHNESEDGSPDGGGGAFASDAILTKVLPSEHSEIFIRFKVRFKSGFKRHWTETNIATMKMFRAMHWDGSASVYTFFTTGFSAPIINVQPYEDEYGGGFNRDILRCDPQATDYFCSYPTIVGNFTDSNCDEVTGWSDSDGGMIDSNPIGIFDGNEHTIIVHLKMNTATNVADGIYRIYYDDCMVSNITNMQYIQPGGDINAGWNIVHLGGNVLNNYLGITNNVFQAGAEQWYSLDGIVAATTLQEAIDGPTAPVYDTPIVTILTESQSTTSEAITIIGTLTTDAALTGLGVDVNGVTATADDGTFDEAVEAWTALGVTLSLGANTITATGTDSDSATDTDTVSITRTVPVKTSKINGSAVLKGAVIHQ